MFKSFSRSLLKDIQNAKGYNQKSLKFNIWSITETIFTRLKVPNLWSDQNLAFRYGIGSNFHFNRRWFKVSYLDDNII